MTHNPTDDMLVYILEGFAVIGFCYVVGLLFDYVQCSGGLC